ncbi:MAG: aminomethyl-transferring glycine dehydrogenase subunit GcvPA [Victivallales bacterium]|nr:aminomethyl-transferring glycine dehydrogenase subunit GcvPA [Victivallales bacterium]MCF7888628.1 aminomethyl-transferring glycine dehydrogenase subunit GcvPA [Victivallales bacterium]
MPYIANTKADQEEMLEAIGCKDFEEMWEKAEVFSTHPDLSKLPKGRSEYEVLNMAKKLASQNATDLVNFIGGGYYDHYIPAAVNEITGRSDFYTAYTPYQPEASQGTLQATFEYQTAICRLTGMYVSNASMYDGGTALFEAITLACRVKKKNKAVISAAVSPVFRKMIHCYSSNLNVELVEIPEDGVKSNQQMLVDAVDEETACVLVQHPNFFGTIEEWTDFVEKIHNKKALAVCSVYPTALALLKSPGEMGFDIVTGEGQCLGNSLSFGGPYLGIMATTKKCMRKMPGRIVGKTVDKDGRDGYVLTLQTREQHIRRSSAVSNICSNEGLCALTASAYLTCLGKEGFRHVAKLCAAKAVYLKNLLLDIEGVEPVGEEPFFNEFIIKLPCDASEVARKLIDIGFAGGFPLGQYYPDRSNQLLIAATEKRTKQEIKNLATALEAILWN